VVSSAEECSEGFQVNALLRLIGFQLVLKDRCLLSGEIEENEVAHLVEGVLDIFVEIQRTWAREGHPEIIFAGAAQDGVEPRSGEIHNYVGFVDVEAIGRGFTEVRKVSAREDRVLDLRGDDGADHGIGFTVFLKVDKKDGICVHQVGNVDAWNGGA
jgi:hypothetical protein